MKKTTICDSVRAHTTDPRTVILAVRFLLGRSYRGAEPVTRTPYSCTDFKHNDQASISSLVGVILRVRGLWPADKKWSTPLAKDDPTLLEVRAWLAVPEEESRRLRREQSRAAFMAAKKARYEAHQASKVAARA